MFSGKYQTDVPKSYFEQLSALRTNGKKRKSGGDDGSEAKRPTVVVSDGAMNVRNDPGSGVQTPVSQEDIRYVSHELISGLHKLINVTVFIISLLGGSVAREKP